MSKRAEATAAGFSVDTIVLPRKATNAEDFEEDAPAQKVLQKSFQKRGTTKRRASTGLRRSEPGVRVNIMIPPRALQKLDRHRALRPIEDKISRSSAITEAIELWLQQQKK